MSFRTGLLRPRTWTLGQEIRRTRLNLPRLDRPASASRDGFMVVLLSNLMFALVWSLHWNTTWQNIKHIRIKNETWPNMLEFVLYVTILIRLHFACFTKTLLISLFLYNFYKLFNLTATSLCLNYSFNELSRGTGNVMVVQMPVCKNILDADSSQYPGLNKRPIYF